MPVIRAGIPVSYCALPFRVVASFAAITLPTPTVAEFRSIIANNWCNTCKLLCRQECIAEAGQIFESLHCSIFTSQMTLLNG